MTEINSFADVMGRLRDGDSAAARDVFHRFANRLIALAQTHLGQRLRQKVDPEDVLQSVYKSFFVRHAQGQFELENWESLWGLLTIITLRKCGRWRDRFHAGNRNVNKEVAPRPKEEEGGGWEALDREPTPAEAAVLNDVIEQLLASLSDRDRQIVVLSMEGRNAHEISGVINRAERTVRRILTNFRRHLEKAVLEPAVLA